MESNSNKVKGKEHTEDISNQNLNNSKTGGKNKRFNIHQPTISSNIPEGTDNYHAPISGSLLSNKEEIFLPNSHGPVLNEGALIENVTKSTDALATLVERNPLNSGFLVYVDNSTGSPVISQVVGETILRSSNELPQSQTDSGTKLSYFDSGVLTAGKTQSSIDPSEQPVTVVFDSALTQQAQQQIYINSSSLVDLNQSVVMAPNETLTMEKDFGAIQNQIIATPNPGGAMNSHSLLVGLDERHSRQPADKIISVTSVNLNDEGKIKDRTECIADNKSEFSRVEWLKEKHWQDDRHKLEQSHLAHQSNLSQQRIKSKDDLMTESALEDHLKSLGIDDKTPIFTSISAQVNPLILKHVPGCQHFLLNESKVCNMTQTTTSPSRSDEALAFHGTITDLMALHNRVKTLMHFKSQTNFGSQIIDHDKNSTEDKSVYCNLMAPYISSKGRMSKQSLKAKEADTLLALDDEFLPRDNKSDVDGEGNSPNKTWRRRRVHNTRTRVQHEKNISSSVMANSESNLEGAKSFSSKAKKDEEKPKDIDASAVDVDLNDPLQMRLRQEQIVYKQIVDKTNKMRQLNTALIESSKKKSLEQDGNSEDQLEGKLDQTKDLPSPKRRRGRPPKRDESSENAYTVTPRNPLTESAATKQQRSYEEHIPFKFFCDHCSFKTKRKSHFVAHLQCHEKYPNVRHFCSTCDFVSISLPALRRHELKHKKNILRCEICTVYKTDKRLLMERHIKMKHSVPEGRPRLQCESCPANFSTSRGLLQHQAKHIIGNVKSVMEKPNDNSKYACSQCGRVFCNRIHLRRHIRDVHGPEVRPYLCDKCGKGFKRTDALQQHKLVHIARSSRKLPFKCEECDKCFRSQSHLKEHQSIHSTERPFLCHYCGAAFKTQPVQKKHILTLHIRPRTHVCGVCCRQFNTKSALQKHESTHKSADEPVAEGDNSRAAQGVGKGSDAKSEINYKPQEIAVLGVDVAKALGPSMAGGHVTSAVVVNPTGGTTPVVLDQGVNMVASMLNDSQIRTNPPGGLSMPTSSGQDSEGTEEAYIHNDDSTGQSFVYITTH